MLPVMKLYANWFQIVLKQERLVAGASGRGHAERRSHAEQEFHRQFRSRERRSSTCPRGEISWRRLYVGHLALSDVSHPLLLAAVIAETDAARVLRSYRAASTTGRHRHLSNSVSACLNYCVLSLYFWFHNTSANEGRGQSSRTIVSRTWTCLKTTRSSWTLPTNWVRSPVPVRKITFSTCCRQNIVD